MPGCLTDDRWAGEPCDRTGPVDPPENVVTTAHDRELEFCRVRMAADRDRSCFMTVELWTGPPTNVEYDLDPKEVGALSELQAGIAFLANDLRAVKVYTDPRRADAINEFFDERAPEGYLAFEGWHFEVLRNVYSC